MGRPSLLRLLGVVAAAAAIALATLAVPVGAASSDDELIAYEADGDIWVVHPDGTGAVNVTDSPDVELDPALSSDGRIAFVRVVDEPPVWARELWIMAVDGSGRTRLAGANDVNWPNWSPDAASVVFYDNTAQAIMTIEPDGTDLKVAYSGLSGTPSWSPDGRIVFHIGSPVSCASSLYVMDADGGNLTPLGVDGFFPAWSPDGTTIAHVYGCFGSELRLVDVATHVVSSMGPTDTGEASWSPDGSRLAYEFDRTIYVMNPDGSGITVIASGATPSWAVVGTRFAFAGFFQPVDNIALNIARAGSAIPVKFSLGGDQGLDVLADGYPKVVTTACDTGVAADVIETYTAGGSGLTYDASTDRYTYAWKTNKAWAGTCRELQVQLVDGSMHTAAFQFK